MIINSEDDVAAIGIVKLNYLRPPLTEDTSPFIERQKRHDLVDPLGPSVVVVPQLKLDAFTIQHLKTISITDSIVTLPQNDNKGPITDFGILILRLILRNTGMPISDGVHYPHFLNGWLEVKVDALLVGALVEVKRPPTRNAKKASKFARNMKDRLIFAQSDLPIQAKEAFRGNPETNSIVLIAMSGEWMAWKRAMRDTPGLPRRTIVLPVRGTDERDVDVSAGHCAESGSVAESLSAPLPITSGAQQAQAPGTNRPLLLDFSIPGDLASPQNRGERLSAESLSPLTPLESDFEGVDSVESIPEAAVPTGRARHPVGTYAPEESPSTTSGDVLSFTRPKRKRANRRSKKDSNKNQPPPPEYTKVRKANSKRWTPDDPKLVRHIELQTLLTVAECDDPHNLYTGDDQWSLPTLFGTEVAKQNWFIIRQLLEIQQQDLNAESLVHDADSDSQGSDMDDELPEPAPSDSEDDDSDDDEESGYIGESDGDIEESVEANHGEASSGVTADHSDEEVEEDDGDLEYADE
ncbi:hypothetical protein DXG03_007701 [Asterophora parasitica]|uniref:Uncharacterized protein n=1 Tax=Asterophora parasitica TaxID=117018 RepID=A0A9P7G225_9AGAR|nr:hypothetical protein DXG03_007701 [Asterophora parasitica]